MQHKEKVKLAKRINTSVVRDGKGEFVGVSTPRSRNIIIGSYQPGLVVFSLQWQSHRDGVARRVEKQIIKIKAAIAAKKGTLNASQS